jgi:hypothetical protein
MHEATYKQFMTAIIQDSSGKHPDTTLKPKGISRNKSAAIMEWNYLATIINHLANIINSSAVNQKISCSRNKQIAVANQNQQLSVTITNQKPSDSYHSETNNQTSRNPI